MEELGCLLSSGLSEPGTLVPYSIAGYDLLAIADLTYVIHCRVVSLTSTMVLITTLTTQPP